MTPASMRRLLAAAAAGVLVAVLHPREPVAGSPLAVEDPPAPAPAKETTVKAPENDAPGEVPFRLPLPSPEEIAALPPDGGPEFNRLVFESSPYLLQHARNPVDWYPWGEEAFARARREDRPVFLSVGYSTCHWCHVMEHESFENEAIAKILNANFVCVKVDREERPDVDGIYMAVLQGMTGGGGWPMSMFLTPDRRPFTGGTYFPPEDRYGRPGFATVLTRVRELWDTDRARIEESAGRLTEFLKEGGPGKGSAELGPGVLEAAGKQYRDSFDGANGGFGPAPKFPRSHSLSFLLRLHARTGDPEALHMVEATLDRIARGGIHDHIGGGFHRYSTDPVWLVPHFEKMLYDQALLARTFLEAWQVTGREEYAAVARDVFEYVLRDLRDPAGGFHSAEDADSEGEEGKFYVWTRADLLRILGKEDGDLFARVYGAVDRGNWSEEASGAPSGTNILHLPVPLEEAARRTGVPFAEPAPRLAALRATLLAERSKRVRPHLDDKVLTDWNGLMIGALAYGGRALGEPRYTGAAREAAGFLLDTMMPGDRLLHRYRKGDAAIPGFLDDHAFLGLGLLDLYEATFETRWLAAAKRLAGEMRRLYLDGEGGGFHLAAAGGKDLIHRQKDLYDGAIPSGNSAAALLLLRLGRLTADAEAEGLGRATLQAFSGDLVRFPMGYPFLLMALDFSVGPTREIVLAGTPGEAGLEALRARVDRRFAPRTVVALHPPGAAGKEAEALIPYLAGQGPVDGKAAAYVCENYACKLPVTTADALEEMLERR